MAESRERLAVKCRSCGVENPEGIILCADCGKPLCSESPKLASEKKYRWAKPALLACGLLAAFCIGYFLRDLPFEASRLSSDFRKAATPAYVALIRMSSTNDVTDADYQKARFDAEAALAEVSPSVRTTADHEAYISLRHLLESTWTEDGWEQMLQQDQSLRMPDGLQTFHQDRRSDCWAVVRIYFDPAGKHPDETQLRQSKRDCPMEWDDYLKRSNKGTATH
jgi:hypothetical protein